MHNPYHVIHHLLPARHKLPYNIRQRYHDRQLSIISGQLRNWNFIYHNYVVQELLLTLYFIFILFVYYVYFMQMCSVISV